MENFSQVISSLDSFYCKFYCEENVWRFLEIVSTQKKDWDFYAVFISNKLKEIPILHQKSGSNRADGLVIWDYHCVCLGRNVQKNPSEFYIFDFDSNLSFPIQLQVYLAQSFSPDWKPEYQPLFRVISSQHFLDNFSSDRCHMLDQFGAYLHPPPSLPPIQSELAANNLHSFIDMEHSSDFTGVVLKLDEFVSYMTSCCSNCSN
eukprot:Sdes_comp22614_c0_seq1m21041